MKNLFLLPLILLLLQQGSLAQLAEFGRDIARGIFGTTSPPAQRDADTRAATTTQCGQTYPVDQNSSYVLQPQTFGSIFAPMSACVNKFLGTNGCNPTISCPEFKLVNAANCPSDYLEVSDGLNSSQRFCGNSGPVNTTSGISIMQIKSQVGVFSNPKTFKCYVTCSAAGSSETHVISSPPSQPKTANCTCGIPGPGTQTQASRIVGGETAPNNFWKWQTAMVFTGRNGPFCGGALINDRFVLTAAHCVVMTGLAAMPAAAQVVFNEYNTSTTDDGPTVRRNVVRITYHPFYNPNTQDYDVSVIEFSPPLDLTATQAPTQTPVCLPPRGTQSTYESDNGTVIGWGTTSEGGDQPSTLMQATIPIISNEDCNKAYNNDSSNGIQITPRMICAQYRGGGVDSCQGDSGGPYMLGGKSEPRYMHIGVVSFGEGCARADKPGVYARTTDLNDWIRQTAWSGTWCQE